MALMNTRARYGRVAQLFHWSTALLILTLLPLGLYMASLPIGTSEEVATKVWFYSLHKTLGVTVLALAILRILWAAINPRPVPLHPERRLETFAAETVHWILYAAIVLAPLTGLLHHASSTGFAPIWWPFGQDLPFVPKNETLSLVTGYLHWAIAAAMAVSLAAHVGGAMKHLVIDRDQTIARMVRGAGAPVRMPQAHPAGHGFAVTAATLFIVGAVGGGLAYGLANTPERPAASMAGASQVADPVADSWIVDHAQSTLKIGVRQLGSLVEGEFAAWSADIRFDPQDLASASVEARIDTASLAVGTVSSQAIGPEFLDAETHPAAVFSSTDFRAAGEGAYEAHGTLLLHGIERPLVLPFTLDFDGAVVRMSAAVTLNRMDYDVGRAAHASEDSVGFAIEVKIDLVARKAEPPVGS